MCAFGFQAFKNMCAHSHPVFETTFFPPKLRGSVEGTAQAK